MIIKPMFELPILELNYQIQKFVSDLLLESWKLSFFNFCILSLEIKRVLPRTLNYQPIDGVYTWQMMAIPVLWRKAKIKNLLNFNLFLTR